MEEIHILNEHYKKFEFKTAHHGNVVQLYKNLLLYFSQNHMINEITLEEQGFILRRNSDNSKSSIVYPCIKNFINLKKLNFSSKFFHPKIIKSDMPECYHIREFLVSKNSSDGSKSDSINCIKCYKNYLEKVLYDWSILKK